MRALVAAVPALARLPSVSGGPPFHRRLTPRCAAAWGPPAGVGRSNCRPRRRHCFGLSSRRGRYSGATPLWLPTAATRACCSRPRRRTFHTFEGGFPALSPSA
eukprot:8949801-Alexandrium_andersonii.AAC.1